MTVIFRATNNQTLKILENIVTPVLKFDCNYGHHHSKARYRALAPWGGGLLVWILFILLFRSYSMDFSAAHRELTHWDSQKAVRVAVPVVCFLNKCKTTPSRTVSQHKMTSVRNCYPKCSYSHKFWNGCLSTSCSELATIPFTLINSCVGGCDLGQMHMSISLSE